MIFGIFAAFSVTVLVLAQTIAVPGLLLIYFFFNAVRTPRGLAVTDSGLVLTKLGFGAGRPTEGIAAYPFGALAQPNARVKGSQVLILLGSDTLTVRQRDYTHLLAGVPTQVLQPGEVAGGPPLPPPPQP